MTTHYLDASQPMPVKRIPEVCHGCGGKLGKTVHKYHGNYYHRDCAKRQQLTDLQLATPSWNGA